MANATSGNLTYSEPDGYDYVTLTDISNENITAISGFAVDDLIEWENPSNESNIVSVSAGGVITGTTGDTFDIRYYDDSLGTWGAFALETVPASSTSENWIPSITTDFIPPLFDPLIR